MNPYEPTTETSERCDCNRITWVDAKIIFLVFGLGFFIGMIFCSFTF